jgi:hypothetical protein
MAGIWYYAHDETRIGPFSSRQLKELASTGAILLSDTIWKEGIAKGVVASRVKDLFPLTNGASLKAVKPPAGESVTAANSTDAESSQTEVAIFDNVLPLTLVPLKKFVV